MPAGHLPFPTACSPCGTCRGPHGERVAARHLGQSRLRAQRGRPQSCSRVTAQLSPVTGHPGPSRERAGPPATSVTPKPHLGPLISFILRANVPGYLGVICVQGHLATCHSASRGGVLTAPGSRSIRPHGVSHLGRPCAWLASWGTEVALPSWFHSTPPPWGRGAVRSQRVLLRSLSQATPSTPAEKALRKAGWEFRGAWGCWLHWGLHRDWPPGCAPRWGPSAPAAAQESGCYC